jgi:putative heme-binding domain-containing protein
MKAVAIEATFVNAWLDEELRPRLDQILAGRNFEQGQRAFSKARCMECHRIAGEGGSTGHDLTGVASRFTREDLLDSILEPSKEISDQYQDYEILTTDGILLVGNIEGRTVDTVTLRTQPPAEVLHEIHVDDIEIQRPHPLSRMPAGLLNVLTMDEVLDLLAYTLSGADPSSLYFQ